MSSYQRKFRREMYLPKESVDKLDQCAHSVQLELSLLQHSKVDVSSGQANLSNCLSTSSQASKLC